MIGKNQSSDIGKETQWKLGKSGNPDGRPVGSKNLASIIKDLEDPLFDWSLVPIKQKDAAKKIGSPWRAIVYTALGKAYSGDVKAMEWLRKSGYGDKLDLTTLGKELPTPILGGISAIHQDDGNDQDKPA